MTTHSPSQPPQALPDDETAQRLASSDKAPNGNKTASRGAAWRGNFAVRSLAGIPALLAVLGLIAYAPLSLLGLVVAAAGCYGYYEYLALVQAGQRLSLPVRPLVGASILIGLGGLLGLESTLGAGLLLAVALVVGRLWFGPERHGGSAMAEAGAALGGLVLIPWSVNHLSLLLQLPQGRGLTALLVVALALNDTLAYLVGSLLGRTPLLPRVSPRKTVEGALGGVVGGLAAGLLAWLWLGGGAGGFSLLGLGGWGMGLAVAGQAGDLLESKLKRLNNAVQSGRFLPGHGGLLDRLDAFLLAAPLFYYLLAFLR
jgi:phosphatidate cytidylyltransferase